MKPEHKEEMKARSRNIRLTVAYDGTAYNGFQRQNPPQVAVQNVLEEYLAQVFGDTIELAASGRTDSGVHARGQVVNFFTNGKIPVERIPRAVNSLLPPDIVVLDAAEAARDFSARHSAVSKTYIYRILQGYIPDPFERNYSWNIHKELDTDSMALCMKLLEGTHDFSAFRAAGGPPVSPVRTIYEASLRREGRIVELKFFANGFLYHMVRNMVGTLANVGMGRMTVAEFQQVMDSLDRRKAGATAPARGLYLYEVNY